MQAIMAWTDEVMVNGLAFAARAAGYGGLP